ncbi:terminase family protein [uncultured Meiothermus sp.]|jgi:phage FluMu gp28-like protein|uniref:terminase large subunit domain-containing protein n=1 Tax=uncultured Meiothermus sp. TaxID=157471 RepID=UPI002623466D|nr:terminase family protein [uncultured Meiothermus sp.]
MLLPYQKRWVEDRSRFKIWLAARQIGKSFAATLETVDDSVQRKTLWIHLASGQRQTLELAEKVKLHLDAYQIAAKALEDTFFDGEQRVTQFEYRLPNGSRHLFLPANPATARGYSGNLNLDEFAFHKDPAGIWRAVFPIITRNPSYKVRITSTPNGQLNQFAELWHKAEGWSRHKTSIYDAVADGLAVDPEELRIALNDPLAWQQEYLLEFLDESSAFIPYDLILAAESPDTLSDEWIAENAYLGMDIARRRDLTVIWIDEVVGDVAWCRKIVELHNTPFHAQLEALLALIPRVRRACIDSTGMGEMLAEEARRRFGWKVEPVQFNLQTKADLAQNLRLGFEDRKERIPRGDQTLRQSLHSIKRILTSAGNVRYDAERNEAGHADHFWAKALAKHARGRVRGPIEYHTVQRSRFAGREERLQGTF